MTWVLTLLLAVPAVILAAPSQALDPAGVGPRDPLQRRFPAYYTDDNGVALQICDNGRAACALTRPADLEPPNGEAFYWVAIGELVSPGIDLSVEFAIEAAWVGRTPIVFDRLRVRGHVDEAGTYTLVHPYGTLNVTAGDPILQRNVNFTQDVGCAPLAGQRCDFGTATTSAAAHVTTFLRSTNAPRGYLGNPDSPSTVTGGERQSMSVTGPAGSASTDQFSVMGKIANPHGVSLARVFEIGNVRRTKTRKVRLLNIGTQPLRLRRISLRGDRSIRRVATATPCGRGKVLAVGRACTVGLRYKPDGSKLSRATLRINDNTPAGGRSVQVSALTAAVLSARARVRFGSHRAGSSGPTRRIVVTNTGKLPMHLSQLGIRGRSRGSFERRTGAPRVCEAGITIRKGGQCAVYVAFEPRGFGTKRARVVVRSDALGSPHAVRLSGRSR